MSVPVQFEVSGSHYEVGLAIGQRFAVQIHETLDGYSFLQKQVLAYHHTPSGQARYRELWDLNRARYPDYLAELEGLAAGADRPFDELFLVNMRGEYGVYLHGLAAGCSDCAVLTPDQALIGHNEDGDPVFDGNLLVIHAQVEGKPAFTSLAYPGFLCGNAFGFNREGICFTIDHVQPRKGRVGLVRQFMARSLLEAQCLDDAIARVTVPERAAGFSYTIGSVAERRIVHVEVAPAAYAVREVEGAYFHANHYRELASVPQVIGSSSRVRVKRASTMLEVAPPKDAAGVLAVLGDQADERYPIHRMAAGADSSLTYCTALFDLDGRSLHLYTGHPLQSPDEYLRFAL